MANSSSASGGSAGRGPASEPGRSYHPLGSRAAAGADAALDSRRAAITELGDALRDLVEQASATEVGGDVLRQVAAQVRQAAAQLGQRTRTRADLPSADDLFGGVHPDATDPIVAHD